MTGQCRKRFINGVIVTPHQKISPGYVEIEESEIKAVGLMKDLFPADGEKVTTVDVEGNYIIPGLIEIHSHGGWDADVMDGTPEAVLKIAAAHAGGGVTSILPTTLTSSLTDLHQAIEAFKEAKKVEGKGAKLLGLHLEGPYFSPEMSGAQDQRFLKNPDPEEYLPLVADSDVKRWSVAPELPGALKMGEEMRKHGVLAAIGHSNADYHTVLAALDVGYTHITHLYSCTSTVTRKHGLRIAGIIEASYLVDDLSVEIIADGKHLPPSLLQLVYKLKGPERIVLVSDSMRAMGMPEGEYMLGGAGKGQKVVVKDGVAGFPDWKSLAGSVQRGNELVRNMVELADVSLLNAVKMMTVNPAKLLGINGRKGRIAPGMDADLTLLDRKLNVVSTIVEGRVVYQRAGGVKGCAQ